tara:strand:+ start:5812 stop:7020 length:1209 start_codon:yes stop_codon:yes gene_type:complete
MYHGIFDGIVYKLMLSRIFLIDFLKILRLAKQRFRDLEKEMLTPFCDSYDPEPIPDEDALDLLIGKFKNTIIDLKSDIMGTANPSDISRVTDCLLFAALDATESGVAMEKSNCAFCSPEKNDVVNDLRKRKLMCSEVLFRCRQLDACFNSGHRLAHSVDELIDASEALEVMCKELFSVCMSITRHVFATWSEWWTTTLQRIATFLIRHVADIASRWRESNSRGAAFLATGNLRAYDCLGRNLAHHMFDASDGGKNGDWQVVLLAHMQSCTAELDEQDGFGRTVLHIACQKNYFITIEWLLQHGANPSLLTVDGHSPLHYAAAQGFIRICEMLLDRKDSFDIDQGDSFYLTARDYASDNRSHEIVDLIDKARVLNDMKRTTSSPEDHGSQEGTPEAWASRLGV